LPQVGRDVQPSVTFVSCGAQRAQSKLCGPASRPRERVDATRSRSRRMARGRITTCYMDAARISTQQLWKPEGFRVARCATLLVGRSRQPQTCAAPRMAISGNPPTTPSSAFMLSSPPRHATSAARSSAARAYTRRPGNRTPPRATRGRLSAHGPLGRTRTRSSSRNDEPACVGSGASSGDECVSLVPVAHEDALM